MRLVIISGRSGSGKTICLNVLEDMGFYCVNNLPLVLLQYLPSSITSEYDKVAVSVDVRNLAGQAEQYQNILDQLDQQAIKREVIFLDSSEKKLLERYSETRRKHPLSNTNTSLQEAIQKEQNLLAPIQNSADLVIDTSHFTIYELRDLLRKRVAKQSQTLSLLFQSFAFKRGVPRDSDFVFDVRCLPNPYWEPRLRAYTGKDKIVAEWLSQQSVCQTMLNDIQKFLHRWINENKKQDRNYLTIAIGCTGGQHRSVFITEQLAQLFTAYGENVQIRHSELL